MSDTRERTDPQLALIQSYLKQLRLPAIARDCVALAREAEQQGAGYLGYLQTLLAQEVAQRHDHQLRRSLRQAQFPYEKRLEDFDFSVVPSVPKTRVLELAQGAYLAQQENVLLVGPSGLGKTHLLIGLVERQLDLPVATITSSASSAWLVLVSWTWASFFASWAR